MPAKKISSIVRTVVEDLCDLEVDVLPSRATCANMLIEADVANDHHIATVLETVHKSGGKVAAYHDGTSSVTPKEAPAHSA